MFIGETEAIQLPIRGKYIQAVSADTVNCPLTTRRIDLLTFSRRLKLKAGSLVVNPVRSFDQGAQEMLEPEAVTTIIRLGKLGWRSKRIAKELGVARNTVRRYVTAGGWLLTPGLRLRVPPRAAKCMVPNS